MDPEESDGDLILGILAFSLGIVEKEVWVIMFSHQADLDMTSTSERATFGASLLLLLAAGNRIQGGSNDLIPTSQLMKIWQLLMEIKWFSLWNIKQHRIWKVIHYLSYVSRTARTTCRKHVCFTSHVTYFCFPHLNAISRKPSASRCHRYQPYSHEILVKKNVYLKIFWIYEHCRQKSAWNISMSCLLHQGEDRWRFCFMVLLSTLCAITDSIRTK